MNVTPKFRKFLTKYFGIDKSCKEGINTDSPVSNFTNTWAGIEDLFNEYQKVCLVSTKEAKSPEEILQEVGQFEYFDTEKKYLIEAMKVFAQQFQQGTYTRYELIEKFKSVFFGEPKLQDLPSVIADKFELIFGKLADTLLGKVGYPNSEWVSVEKKPAKTDNYLVLNINSPLKDKIEIAKYESYTDNWFNENGDIIHPTEYQPLPAPPINKSLNQSK